MNPIKETELLKIQEWRCSIKSFDNKRKIPDQTWQAIEQSLILSPSSFGLQPWKFCVVTNDEIRQKLLPHSWNQTQVTHCSHLLVFCYLNSIDHNYIDKFVKSIITTRGVSAEKTEGYKQIMKSFIDRTNNDGQAQNWAIKQVYIALGNFMTSAAALGVDTCPMEGIDPAKYDEILGLKGSNYSTVVTCAAGYRDESDVYSKLKKVRFSPEELIQRF